MTALVPQAPSRLTPQASARQLAPVPTPHAISDADGIDLATIFEVVRRRYKLLIAVFVAVSAIAVALTVHQKPKYTATSAVMMDPRQIQVLHVGNSPNVSGDLQLNTEAVATQVQVLTSRTMAERVVDSLHLDQDSTLVEDNGGGIRARLVHGVQNFFHVAPKPVVTAEEHRQAVVDTILSRLDVQRLGLTYVIGVKYTDPQRERAAAIANGYANSYVQLSIEGKSDATKQAGGYIDARLHSLSDQAAADAASVQAYRVNNNLLGRGSTLTDQETSNLNGQITTMKAEVAADQAKLDTAREQMKHGSAGDDVGAALGSPVIQGLRSQRAVVSGQIAELNSRYGPKYPDVIKAQQQLADLDQQIKTEINRVISNLQANVQVSAGRLRSLEGTYAQSRGTLAVNTRAEAGLLALQQKAAASQALYDTYLARYKEVVASAGTEQSDARIVSQAQPPSTPSSPRVVLDLALGGIVALVLSVGAVMIAEIMDPSFTYGAEVERRLHAPYLGSIPILKSVAKKSRLTPTEYVVGNPFSVFAEGFRNIKVSVLQAWGGQGAAVVAVSSPLTNEGKTTTSVCLGQTSALQGARTIVVDCDLRRRTLRRFLNETPGKGLVEVVRGEAELDEVIVADPRTGLNFLPVAETRLTVDDVFGSEGMDRLLAQLRERYDFIILDTAPLLALSDARILAAKADAVVLLCRWRKTPQDALKSALRLLQTAEAPIAGVALTRVDIRKQTAYGYGDSTFYYREAQDYYAA